MTLGTQAAPAALRGDELADLADAALAAEELAEALQLYDRAEPEVADPDRCAGGRWMAHMLAGDLEAAWTESDAIRARGAPDPHRFWQGEDLRGKRLMLRSLHGFGDAVQMEIMELPYALRVSSQRLAPCQGYLRLPTEEQQRVREVLGAAGPPRVGLVWCAGSWNPSRSLPFEAFRPLLQTHGVAFWSLQGEPERGLWLAQGGGEGCKDAYACGEGLLALAAVIEQMDLVITVDTLAAHLAGALGVPCWLLLQHRADWRWMSARDDSPWYPSLRLFRQPAQGDWTTVLRRVQEALGLFVQAAGGEWRKRPE